MNERIRELAEQSGMTQYVAAENKYLERFAKLIVRECLSYTKDGDIDFMKFMIRKHFGVEE